MGRWAGLFLALAVTGCASGGGGGEPTPAMQRPMVTVTDTAATVDRAQLIGTWACRELNPVPGHAPAEQTIRYDADGKGSTSSVVDASQTNRELSGRYDLDFTYDWTVDGGKIVASNVHTKATPADSSDSSGALARLTEVVVSSFGATGRPGAAEVLQQNHDKLVLKAANVEGGPILSCTRTS